MSVRYFYNYTEYATEEAAQNAVSVMRSRLENNPTDWCYVKEIQHSDNEHWLVLPNKLSDAEINNPDVSKTYMVTGKYSGETSMPITASELPNKVLEHRQAFVSANDLTIIYMVDSSNSEPNASVTEITPNEDMSGYV